MIKVIHISLIDGHREESKFNDMGEWRAHLESHADYFVSFENEVIDITIEAEKEAGLITREQELEACQKVIKLVGFYNKSKPDGIVLQILTSPQMQGVIFALLTGSPKTAKGGILQLGANLYSKEEISEVVAVLDAVI